MTSFTQCDVSKPVQLRISSSANGGAATKPPTTLIAQLKTTVEKWGDKPALVVKRNGANVIWTYKQYLNDAYKVAKALISLDINAYSCAGILSYNYPEWNIIEIGCIHAAIVPFGIYSTNGAEACHFALDHSSAAIVFVENNLHLQKILSVRDKLPKLKAIVQIFGTIETPSAGIYSWNDFLNLGEKTPTTEVEARISNITPGNCCYVIYTSGTVGDPKAVMISHDNITWIVSVCIEMTGVREGSEVLLSFLPLSHAAAQAIDIHLPIASGSVVHFAGPDALKGQLVETLKEVRPTLFLGVPRVWEKVAERMQQLGAEQTGIKKWISNWAQKKGLAGNMALQDGKNLPTGWWLADKLVFSKVKAALGLDRCRVTLTGAAPINIQIITYFMSLDIPLYDIYGMSEATISITCPTVETYKLGNCGRPVDGTELVISQPDHEGNGEILVRGRHVMMGFMNNPEGTNSEITSDGFLKTGDIGKIDADGGIVITGRIKEIIITANGEKIAPLTVEACIKNELSIISNAMVMGDKRQYLTCILTLKSEVDDDGLPTDTLAPSVLKLFERLGIKSTTVSDALKDPQVLSLIDEGMSVVNRKVSNSQHIQKWKLLPVDFSVIGNELGPTLKLKRRVVYKKYKDIIESMYSE